MKKRLLSIAFVAAIAATASWNFAQSENKVNLSDLALENVVALAGCEVNGWIEGQYWVTIFSGCLWTCNPNGPVNCPI